MNTKPTATSRPSRQMMREEPEYKRVIDTMVRAALEYLDMLTGDVYLQFAPFPEGPLFTGALDAAIPVYGQNETTRELLRVMDKASDHNASLAMARLAVDIIEYGEDN